MKDFVLTPAIEWLESQRPSAFSTAVQRPLIEILPDHECSKEIDTCFWEKADATVSEWEPISEAEALEIFESGVEYDKMYYLEHVAACESGSPLYNAIGK
jgi:hypothetical protein